MSKKTTLLLLTSLFLLGSCGTNTDSVSSLEESSSSESPSSQIESSEEDIFVINDDTTYETHSWDKTVVEMLRYTVGDAATLIPSVTTTSYAVSIGSETSSDGSMTVKFTDVKCYPVNEGADLDYAQKLKIYGYINSSSYSYSYYKASATEDLIVQYEVVSTDDYKYLSILCYLVEYRTAEWPSELCEAVCGMDLPNYKAEAYEMDFDSYSLAGYIYAYGVSSDADTEYCNQLKKEGWTLTDNSSDSTTLTSPDGWVTVLLYMTYDSYNADALMIKFTSAWPYLELASVMDGDLPKHSNTSLEFDYGWVTISDGSEVLTLYYDGADETDYVTYCSQLEKDGWKLDPSEESSKGTYTGSSGEIYYSYYVKDTHAVDVLYSVSSNTIAIPVYC